MPKNTPIVPLLIIGAAILLALLAFLAITEIQNRSAETAEVPVAEGVETVIIGDQLITLQRDPALAVRLVPPEAQLVEPAQPEAQPTAETAPAEQQPEPTAVPAPTETPVTAQVENRPEAVIFINHTVQQSDTLYSLTRQYATSIALMAIHGISQDDLVPGQTIPLPVGNPEYCGAGNRPYAVGEGDTAFNISQRFNITKEDLRAINNLDEAFTVRIAEILCVP